MEIEVVVYIDSTISIHMVEGHDVFFPRIDDWFQANPSDITASEMTRLESRVKPIRNGDTKILADFDHFFTLHVKYWVALTRTVWDHAANLRAMYPGLKTPDAIHLAAAIEAKCDAFVTNEKRLGGVAEIPVVVIS